MDCGGMLLDARVRVARGPREWAHDAAGARIRDRGGLLAATHSLEEMREIIGADTLAFLTIDGMYRAMGFAGRDPANPKFSDHCFTGAYPTHLTDQTQVEPQPRQLSLLAEAS